MERKYKTILIIVNLIFVFTILSFPTFILLAEYSHLGRIDKSISYLYSSSTPPLNKELNIDAEVGVIDINYVHQPVDYFVRIDLNIEMAGPNLEGKSYLDFFNIIWENMTCSVNFTLEVIPEMLVEFSSLHKANIIINIILRADIVFNIKASTIEGAIELTNLGGITINNVFLNVERGNIKYDFTDCTFEGNITGIVNHGNITLKSYNNQYIQNSELTFLNIWGYTLIDIYQYEEMGANITGTVITKTGIIRLNYKDESPNVGAQFVLYNKTNFGNEVETKWIGFNRTVLPSGAGQLFYSYDFPTQNNYEFTLNKFYNLGDFMWDFYSIPI